MTEWFSEEVREQSRDSLENMKTGMQEDNGGVEWFLKGKEFGSVIILPGRI